MKYLAKDAKETQAEKENFRTLRETLKSAPRHWSRRQVAECPMTYWKRVETPMRQTGILLTCTCPIDTETPAATATVCAVSVTVTVVPTTAVDKVALAVMAVATPEFFDKTFADLRAGGTAGARAQRLLNRYASLGPKNGTADQWAAWWRDNKPYAFASDSSDYCWYIDALAKKRGVPSSELRGAKRADVTKITANR